MKNRNAIQPDLLATAAAEPAPADIKKQPSEPKPKRQPRHGWTLTDHVCRCCFGRVLKNDTLYRCSNCGLTGTDTVKSICACGAKFNTGRDIGIRCIPNPCKSVAHPSEIVASES